MIIYNPYSNSYLYIKNCYCVHLITEMASQGIALSVNHDLESIVTPVNWQHLKFLLEDSNYSVEETKFLVDGFRDGFSLEYRGKTDVKLTAPNLKFRKVGNDTILWNKVMKEVKLKRFAGPFETIPFETYSQSPIGLVPKDNGVDSRLIFHLSYPRKLDSNGQPISVNGNTPQELCTVKYPNFSEAIRLCMLEGKASKFQNQT